MGGFDAPGGFGASSVEDILGDDGAKEMENASRKRKNMVNSPEFLHMRPYFLRGGI
jgi:hypothetical protein